MFRRNKKIKIIQFFIIFVLISLAFFVSRAMANKLIATFETTISKDSPNVTINNAGISVMVADDIEKQWQGLSDRMALGAFNGMLFKFSNKQPRTFVMRRMKFPLDIIWIDGDKVIKIDRRLSPEGENPTSKYESIKPVDYVLEVNGGFADAFSIQVGDKIIIDIE